MFDSDNPLTARVFVNRLWQMHFGAGLVATPEDFGIQGALPTHPELLDWLAIEFIESGWDIKHMHRLMVTSATYRQSSAASPESLAKDPENLLLSRGYRQRLPAEMIRDRALAVSGLLDEEIGGPSRYPYQPPGVWEGHLVVPDEVVAGAGHGAGRRSSRAHALHLRQAQCATAVDDGFRLRRPQREHGQAQRFQYAVAGAGIAQRSAVRRGLQVDGARCA